MATAKVLVVDDEFAVLALVAGALSMQGYEVCAVPDPKQAIELVKKESPCFDLLLSDINMPDVCGPELAREVKLICPTIAVVMMSGNFDVQKLPSGVGFVSKPFLLTDLYSVVAKALAARTDYQQTVPVEGSVRAGMPRHGEAVEDVRGKAS
jgi:two-component system OmpR family response regulator